MLDNCLTVTCDEQTCVEPVEARLKLWEATKTEERAVHASAGGTVMTMADPKEIVFTCGDKTDLFWFLQNIHNSKDSIQPTDPKKKKV